jgi:hypothetical protein
MKAVARWKIHRAVPLFLKKWLSLPLKRCFKFGPFALAEFDRD